MIYLQTAYDIAPYDPAKPDDYAEARTKLDGKRIEAIQKFLNAQAAGHGYVFQVQIHDPADPGGSTAPILPALQGMLSNYRGKLTGTGGSPTGGAGASSSGR